MWEKGQSGNPNGARVPKIWTAAIKRALAKRSRTSQYDAIDEIADKLIELCAAGDLAALKELGDRLEGKATQVIESPDGVLPTGIQITYVVQSASQLPSSPILPALPEQV